MSVDRLDKAAEEADREVEIGSPYTLADLLADQMSSAAYARLTELIPQNNLPEVGPEGLRYIRALDKMGEAIVDAAAVVADTIKV